MDSDGRRPPRSSWSLDAGIAHLNHGSFGAVNEVVEAVQQRWHLYNDPQEYVRLAKLSSSSIAAAAAAPSH